MRIAFDAKRALNNATGLGNHARILLNALMRDYADNEYLLFSPKVEDCFFHELHGDFKVFFPESGFSKLIHPWWRSYGVTEQLMRCRADIYHGLSNELPLNIHRSGIKTVVTIHDLIFLKHKEQYPWADRQIYAMKTRYAAEHADRVIAVSQETKQDLMEMYKVPERKISVIYPSVDTRFYAKVTSGETEETSTRYNLPKKYILHVGSFFPRKNQIGLIEAFDIIKDKIAEDLLLVGGAGNMQTEIQKLIASKNLKHRIRIITDIRNEDLPVLYQQASVFVFPSSFEGFGAPVLEALFSGAPVIASGRGAIAEAAGSGSIFIDPLEPDDIAAKIVTVLYDAGLRRKMTEQGYIHARTMTDVVFAQRTMDVYKELY